MRLLSYLGWLDSAVVDSSINRSSHVELSGSVAKEWRWIDFFILTKPSISLLVVVTTLPGYLWAVSESFTPLSMTNLLFVLLGTWLSSASAATLNQIVDESIDIRMRRTARRPIAAGRIPIFPALSFAAVLAIAGFVLLTKFGSLQAAFWALAANIFYVAFYTMYLKPRTPQNIVIGGAAGAIGPIIGWASVTATGWQPWVLFLLIFLWTPPHFWALALKYKDDYAAANIPMLPNTHGEEATRKQILFYSLLLIPTCLLLVLDKNLSLVFHVAVFLINLVFVGYAVQLRSKQTLDHAMKLFHFSCFYILLVFGALTFDVIVHLFTKTTL